MFKSSKKRRTSRFKFVWKQMNIQFRMRSLSSSTFLLQVIQPAIFGGIGYLLAGSAGKSTPDITYTIIGGGIMGLWSSLVFTSFFDIRNDRRDGTLELIVGSPTSLFEILAIRTLTNVLTGTISLILSFGVAVMIFKLSLPVANMILIFISLFILLLAFWSIGIFLAHLQAISRLSGLFVNYLEFPVAILAGFMFPAEFLPRQVWWLSGLLPVRWAVKALNISFQTPVTFDLVWRSWANAIGIISIFLIVTLYLSRRVHGMIRVTGELSSI